MSEIETQLREYFDATVERVTAEDVLAGRRVYETVRPAIPARTWRPAWVAVGTSAATVAILGGTLAMGAVLTEPTGDLGSGGISDVVHDVTATASDLWPLIAAIALVIAIAGAFLALNRKQRQHEEEEEEEEEDTMATTIDAPPAETTGAADNNRGLIITIVVLAIALLALGAWAIYQQTAESETAAPAAVEDLLADYYAAFNNYDGEAIIALTTQSFVHENSFSTHDRAGFAAVVSEMLPGLGFRLEQVGDPIVAGDGPYYAAEVNYLTQTGADEHGISTFVMIDTSDGLKSRNTSGGATDPSWTEATLKNIPVRLGEEDRDVRYSGRTAPMPAGVSSSPSTVTTPVSAASRADDREPQLAMPLVNAAAPIPVTHQHVAERVVAVVAQWINTAISFRGGFVEVDAMTDLPRANIATTHRPGNGPVSVRLAVSVGGGW